MSTFELASKKWDEKSYLESIEIFLNLAEAGDVSSMERLATIYTCGEGVGIDFEKSIYWDLLAIKSGSQVAPSNLAITYRTIGDIKNSRKWFEEAISLGDGDAALELAKLYMVSEKENETVAKLLSIVLVSKSVCEDSIQEAKKLLAEYSKLSK